MRSAVLALALACALTSYAQTPPDTAPPPAAPPGETAPAQVQAPPEQPAIPPPAGPQEPPPARAVTPRVATPHPPPPQAQPPAPDREGEIAALKAEVSRLQSELDAERAAATPPPAGEAGAPLEPVRSAWEWLVIVALLALAAGFALGWRVLDRRIRRKYGGLRIY